MDKRHEEKIDELIRRLATHIKAETRSLARSGGVDVESYNPESFELARILVTAATERWISVNYPMTNSGVKDVKNLKHF